MPELLVTGAGGQLGWEVTRRAETAGLSCHAANRAALDVTDRDAVASLVRALRPGVVVNAAAYTAVDKAESEVDRAFAVNRDGPAHLAEACAAGGIPLIHVSTDYVFDSSKQAAYTEEDPASPLGVYGASKLAGEEATRAHCPQHVILRTAWVYGIHGHNFVKTMLQLGHEREVLRVVDDQRGSPTFAGDLADAALSITRRLLAGRLPPEAYGTFHCAGQGQTTWCGFARKIFEIAAPRLCKVPNIEAITTAEYPTPARRPSNSVLDCTRLARVYAVTLRRWEEALAEMLDAVLSEDGTPATG